MSLNNVVPRRLPSPFCRWRSRRRSPSRKTTDTARISTIATTMTIVAMTATTMIATTAKDTATDKVMATARDTSATPTTIAISTAGIALTTSICRPDWPSATGLPPGLERQSGGSRNSCRWDSAASMQPCPRELEVMLPPPPPNYVHVVIGGNLVLYNRANFQIADVFHFGIN